MLRAVKQKLNLLAEEIGLDLIQQESGEVTFYYSQVDPNMNIEQYLIYEAIILNHIKHVKDIAKGEEGHLRYLQELAILFITGFLILDPLFMTCENILVC